MPRGGRRKGAGRKTAWESGCTFAETTVIRIPKVLKDEILDLAHRLDAGEEVDLVSKSIKKRNDYLEGRVLELEEELNQPKQLTILSSSPPAISKKQMNKVRDELLKSIPLGSSSPVYKELKSQYNKFIDKLSKVY